MTITNEDLMKASVIPIAVIGGFFWPVTTAYAVATATAGYLAGEKLEAAAKRADEARKAGYQDKVCDGFMTNVDLRTKATKWLTWACPVLPFMAWKEANQLDEAVAKCKSNG